jgi:hypothetical protein
MIAIDWNPNRKALSKFGRSMLIFGLVFALWFWFKKNPAAAWTFAGVGVFCFTTSLFAPPAARVVYVLWMGLAWLLGQLVTPLIMGALYYLVLTPIGMVLRLTGHDRLRLKKPVSTSYWTDFKSSTSYDRQF